MGARKIRELLVRRLDGDLHISAKTTIHAVLHRHGLVKTIRRPRPRTRGTPLFPRLTPNDLWCVGHEDAGRNAFSLTHALSWPA